MTTNLTKTLSKRLTIALLIVVFGAELVLYCMRFSTLADTIYNAIMVASFFVGLKLHPRLKDLHAPKSTKRRLTLKFSAAFLLFFLGSTVINYYSTYVFDDFNENYESFVEDAAETVHSYNPSGSAEENTWSIFDTIDTVGYDIYTDSLAGLEEVWRLSYMILVLMVCKKFFPRRWNSDKRDIFLMLALFLTSVAFGIDHTLSTAQPWSIKLGSIVTFANMGFLFGIILLWTRSLWLTVMVHSVYDIVATLSWYYFDYAVEAFAGLILVVYISLSIFEKKQRKQVTSVIPVQLSE